MSVDLKIKTVKRNEQVTGLHDFWWSVSLSDKQPGMGTLLFFFFPDAPKIKYATVQCSYGLLNIS